jgi:hypothetical protein
VNDSASGIGSKTRRRGWAPQHDDAVDRVDRNVIEPGRRLTTGSEGDRLELTVGANAIDIQQGLLRDDNTAGTTQSDPRAGSGHAARPHDAHAWESGGERLRQCTPNERRERGRIDHAD